MLGTNFSGEGKCSVTIKNLYLLFIFFINLRILSFDMCCKTSLTVQISAEGNWSLVMSNDKNSTLKFLNFFLFSSISSSTISIP